MDFYAIKIFVTCERNFGYLLLVCHKPPETIVFNPKFYEPLKSIKLNWKSIKLSRRQLMLCFLWKDLCGRTHLTFANVDKWPVSH